MKKILVSIFVLSLFLSGFSSQVHAQNANCSETNVTDDVCYEQVCTGQSNADSASCNNYAVMVVKRDDGGDTTCLSINNDNVESCCQGNNGDSPMCIAYDTSTNADNGKVTPQQVGGGAPSTAPLNTAANNTSIGIDGFSSTSSSGQATAACSAIKFNTLLDFAIWAKCLIGAVVIPGIFTLAFVVFLWGVFKFIRASEDKDKQEGKQFIYMGLIGLFVMVSVWGIIKILTNTFGFDSTVPMLQTDYLSTKNASQSTTTPVPASVSKGAAL